MNALLSLWLPILLSAAAVFVISSLIHMVFKYHAPEYRGFANEDAVRAAIRAGNPAPGRYVVPYCADMKEMASEAMVRKYQEGPVAQMAVGPSGAPNIGKHLGQWFVVTVFVSAVAAFLATRFVAFDAGQAARAAKFVGVVSFLAYGIGTIQESIWAMRPWSSTVKYLIDSALYGVGTGLVFWWLWP